MRTHTCHKGNTPPIGRSLTSEDQGFPSRKSIFIKEPMQMDNIHMKRYLVSLMIKGMWKKARIICPLHHPG